MSLSSIEEILTKAKKNMTIKNSKQDWSIGQVVKVGFLQLRVTGVRAEKDWLPDIYSLVSLCGKREYEFIPHNGLKLITQNQ